MQLVKTRLSVMMFLQYAVWGLWLPALARYLQAPQAEGGLGFTTGQVGFILGLAGSIGAITAPFVAGQFADRFFSTEKFLAFLLITGGVIKWVTAYQTDYVVWMVLSIMYSVVFMPTLALTNSIAFAHLKDANMQFPYVRVWGTIGWIAAGWIFPMVWLQTDLSLSYLPPFIIGNEVPNATARLADALIASGAVAIVYGFLCLWLPHTPPKRDAVERLAFKKAFALMRFPSFALLVAVSLPIAVIHQVYFLQAAPYFVDSLGMQVRYLAPAMTVAQFAEILVMVGLGFILKGFGFRWTIVLGGIAYILRFGIWAFVANAPEGASWAITVAVTSQALHGFCYSCFFAAAFIYVDRIAEADVRHSAQTVFGIIILGLGPVLAAPFLDFLDDIFGEGQTITNYAGLWLTLSIIALIATLFFAILFRDETQGEPSVEPYREEEILEA